VGTLSRIRTLSFVVLGLFLVLCSKAEAQTCTHGPYTSATSVGTIDSEIDRAPDGSVVCLRRGNTWAQSGGIALTLTSGHPNDSRVTVCSSDGTQCTDSTGGANARISMTDNGGYTNCMAFSAGGYTIKNIDCYATNGCDSDDTGEDGGGAFGVMPSGLRDVTIEGGVFDGWMRMAYLQWASGDRSVSNVKFGTCSNRMEIRNCGFDAHPRWTWYGICDNCSFSAWIHDYGPVTNTGGQGHILDFSNSGDGQATADNNTVECNLWQFGNGHTGGGDVLRLSEGSNIVIRDNTFENLGSAGCSVSGIGFVPHGGGPSDVTANWDGAEIHRNRFAFGDCFNPGVTSSRGSEVKVHNNVFDLRDKTSDPDYWGIAISTQASTTAPPNNFWVYNNTFYAPENQSPIATVSFCGANCGTGHKFFNNVIQSADSNAIPIKVDNCNSFGTNGVEIKDNFIYTPNDSSPTLPGCSAASGWKPGSPWSTAPGFINSGAGDFGLASTSSPAFGAGAFGAGSAPAPTPTPSPTPTPTPTPAPEPTPTPPPAPPPAAPLAPLLLP
jgi:hypothetical protein